MASFIEAAPWIVVLERHRPVLFSVSGVLLALNYWMVVVRPRRCAPGELCHIDSPFMRFNRRLYWMSLALFVVALAVTYGSLPVLRWIE
jgi:hypothetical protein